MMKPYSLLTLLLFLVIPGLSKAETFILTAVEWAVPRNASSIQSMPALQSAMRAMYQDREAMLRIHYPGGDVGTLWSTELRSWLVALGLESRRIELARGSASGDTLELEVVSTKNKQKPLISRE